MNVANPRRSYAGFTLIEIGIAGTLAAIVTGSAIALFLAFAGLDRRTRENLAETTAIEHLTERFRADVAQAAECSPLDDAASQAGVVLKASGDQSIFYVAGNEEVQRIRYSGKKALQRESYGLGEGGRAIFDVPAGTPPLVSCTIEALAPTGRSDQSIPASAQVRRSMTITAVLGRDWRLAEAVAQASGSQQVESADTTTPEASQP
jgi:type II secretory pathway pseudopilin PulG